MSCARGSVAKGSPSSTGMHPASTASLRGRVGGRAGGCGGGVARARPGARGDAPSRRLDWKLDATTWQQPNPPSLTPPPHRAEDPPPARSPQPAVGLEVGCDDRAEDRVLQLQHQVAVGDGAVAVLARACGLWGVGCVGGWPG